MVTAKLNVALLMGGTSKEREVSLASGREVLAHIDRNRFEVEVYDPATDLARLLNEAPRLDVAFLALHGHLGEDGAVQGFCELVGLPYIGSDVLASAVAMDKEVAKRLYRLAGLPVAPDLMLTPTSPQYQSGMLKSAFEIGSQLVVKPVRQGSSVAIFIVESELELKNALDEIFALEPMALVEKYLPGREFTCGVLGNNTVTALPPIEIIPAPGHHFFDYSAKYEVGEAKEVCPAQIPPELTHEMQELALAAHQSLSCRGLSRTDFMFSGDKLYILETNTLPGLTATSLLPQMAAAHGLSFTNLISYLIDLAVGEVLLADYLS